MKRTWITLLAGLAGFLLLYGFILRPAHMRWGATDAEIAMPLPGDRDKTGRSVTSTRALTIHAPPELVWPWLAQLGQERGGFYSFAWLENLFAAGMHNSERINPAFDPLRAGDRVSYFREGPPGTYGIVTEVEPQRRLQMKGWTYLLQPLENGDTRFIVRYNFEVDPSLIGRYFYYAVFEPAHFVMESGMMLGIKGRAERAAGGGQ
jgi:hypothetical protein